jgi:predicted permease
MIVADLVQDLRYGVRSLLRRPAFAVLAVLILGLGIGANSAIFTLANRMFVSAPPSVDSPSALIRVSRSWAPGQGGSVAYPDYEWYREGSRTLAGLMAYNPGGIAVTAAHGSGSSAARVWLVSDNYFAVLGLKPAAGRFFVAEENETPGTHPVAVISHGYWERVLGGDPSAVGGDVVLNGTRFTVIGIAPRSFRGLGPAETTPDFWLPIMMKPAVEPAGDDAWYRRLTDSHENWLVVVGRLGPGVGVEAARAELVGLHERLKEQFPSEPQDYTVHVTSQYRYYPGTGRSLADMTSMLLVVVGVVLLIASANVAVLLLSRAAVRSREMGVRSALGAGRGRVFRQMVTESLVLALAGGALGLLLSVWGARVAAGLLPFELAETGPDMRVVAFTAGVSVLAALLVGTAPAFQATRADVVSLIRERGRRGARSRLQDGLVVLQVGLSLVLVAGAVLFTRSLMAARTRDVGFDTAGLLLVSVNVRNHGYDTERAHAFLRAAHDRVTGLPGVVRATSSRIVPFQGDWTTDLKPPAGAAVTGEVVTVGLNAVMPDYFETMGIALAGGRGFAASDDLGSDLVVVVNQHLADTFWPGREAVGQLLHVRGEDGPPYRVVGVARNATYYRLGEEPQFQAYGSALQTPRMEITFMMRTAGDPLALARPAQDALHGLDPDLAFSDVGTMEAVFAEEIGRFRIAARLVGLFGVLALVLASVGLYAAVSYRVARRTREIGICMALGATRRRVARSVVGRGLGLAAAGVVLGLAGSFALARLVSGFIFGVAPRDPVTFLVAPLVLLAVAAFAAFVPARRAMAVDPMGAIRAD